MASDETMLILMYILLGNGTIRFKTDFCRDIGLLKQNLKNIEDGKNHFTPEHIEKAVKKYKVNANWIFGVSDKIFLTSDTDSTISESLYAEQKKYSS